MPGEVEEGRSQPALRVSDAERHRVVMVLQEHCAQGRLTVDEFSERTGEALASRTHADLGRALRELPPLPPPPAPVRRLRTKAQRDFALHATTYLLVNVFLVILWLMGGHGYFWPVWVLVAWGLLLALHGVWVYGPFTDE
jgi:uncharacterized protein DUF1707/2TM domain-containing protein